MLKLGPVGASDGSVIRLGGEPGSWPSGNSEALLTEGLVSSRAGPRFESASALLSLQKMFLRIFHLRRFLTF